MISKTPTVDEAVSSVLRCFLLQTRRQQLAWFRQKYGDDFADKVEVLVKQKWKKK